MSLPSLIEIVPLSEPVTAEITVPGSKSITNRALILAVLARGEVSLRGALWSEDTQVMTEALKVLGFEIKVESDPQETCNRHITVKGLGGRIPNAGSADNPLELFVGNAGTVARFLAALCCLGQGSYRLHGVARMHERPQRALFRALGELGYKVNSTQDHLPVVIHGEGAKADARCTVSIEKSSQFASALMLCADVGDWKIAIEGENAEESPYVHMTSELIKVFPNAGGEFKIEPDASSGSYFLGAKQLLNCFELIETVKSMLIPTSFPLRQSEVSVWSWPISSWQIDQSFISLIASGGHGASVKSDLPGLPAELSRTGDLGDSIMTIIALSPLLILGDMRFTNLGRLRMQECERVVALKTELTKCGAKVLEEGDTLTVYPSKLHGAEIETYNDHRMAMCFSILGLKVPGIRIQNPTCVKKTFPNFFQKLAAPAPNGLGATILDAQSQRKLEGNELFAD